MACNSYKMNDVEKMFLGDTKVYILQKMIVEPYQWKCLPWGKGAHLACHNTTPTFDEKHTQTKNM